MKRIFNDEQEQMVIQEYLGGKGSTELAKQFNCSDGTILKLLKRHNIPRRTGGHQPRIFNDKYFDEIDTEAKAYFLGLIAADGSVCQPSRGGQKRFQLELLEQDKYLIAKLCKELQYDVGAIKYYQRKGRNPMAKISITSNVLAESLARYSIVSGKAYSFQLPQLGYGLMRHFLRGLFDGDGSVGQSRMTLVAGNAALLNQIKYYLVKRLCLNKEALRVYKTGTNAYTLSINRKLEREQIKKYLYENSSIAMLRKARWLGNQSEQSLRELLETPEEDNQQPSPESDLSEGSTTSSNSLSETMKDHERGAPCYIQPWKRDVLYLTKDLWDDIVSWQGDDIV